MFEMRPISYFLENFVSCALVSLNGAPARTESGRKPERDGSSGQPMLAWRSDRGAAQDLGVELVGAALDLALDLVEAGDDLVADSSVKPSRVASFCEGVVRAGLPVDQGAVDIEGDEGDLGRERHSARIMPFDRRSTRCGRRAIESATPMDLLEYQGKQLFARHGVPVPDAAPRRAPSRRPSPAADEIGYPVRRQGAGADRRPRQGRRHQGRPGRGRGREHADAILGMDIRGLHRPRGVDRGRRRTSPPSTTRRSCSTAPPSSRWCMLSTQGGMDIEEVADEDPDAIARSTSTRCSASRTSTRAGWPSRPASTPTSCARSARCCAGCTRRSSPRRRCSSRSTR